MDLQENTSEPTPLEQVGTRIKGLVEGKITYVNQVINDISADEFYTQLQNDIVPSALNEYNPKTRLAPLSRPAFERIRAEMHVGSIEYYEDAKAAVIDTPQAIIGVAAFNLTSGKRIALFAQPISNRDLEDFKNLRSDPHAHQTIGS